MRSRSYRRVAVVSVGAALTFGLAACEQILGLDETLEPNEGGIAEVRDGSVGAPDATMRTGDGAAVEGGDDQGGDASDAESSGPLPWHIDTDPNYGGGLGYVELGGRSDTTGSPTGMALVQHPTLGVLVVVLSGDDELMVYRVDQPSAPIQMVNAGADGTFAGALVTPDGGLRVLTEQRGIDFTVHDLAPATFGDVPTNVPDTDDVNIGNLIGLTATGVSAVGNTGPFGAPVAGQFEIDTSGFHSVVIPWASMQPATMLKTEETFDGSTFYGGIDDLGGTGNAYAVWAVTAPDGGIRSGILGEAINDGSGFTDFVSVDDQVFAVGFSDSSFIFSPMPPPTDASTPFAKLDTRADDFYFSSNENPNVDSQLNGEVDVQKRILVGGFFGGLYLGNFLVDGGSDPRAFSDPDLVSGAAVYYPVIDLSKYVSGTGAPSWTFHAMLLADPYLYVTAANTDGNGQWVVFRLVRGLP